MTRFELKKLLLAVAILKPGSIGFWTGLVIGLGAGLVVRSFYDTAGIVASFTICGILAGTYSGVVTGLSDYRPGRREKR